MCFISSKSVTKKSTKRSTTKYKKYYYDRRKVLYISFTEWRYSNQSFFLIFCFVFRMTLVSRKNNFSSLENHWWLKQLLLFQGMLLWPRSLGRTSSSTGNRETRQGRMVRNGSEHPEMAENFISYVRPSVLHSVEK